jgi:hypothetical protein
MESHAKEWGLVERLSGGAGAVQTLSGPSETNCSLMGSKQPEGLGRVDRCRIVHLSFRAVAL